MLLPNINVKNINDKPIFNIYVQTPGEDFIASAVHVSQ